MDNKLIGNEKNILFYNDEEDNTKVEVLLENEDVWLNADALSTLFNIDRSGIVRHINNIYKDEELDEFNQIKTYLFYLQILVIFLIFIIILLFYKQKEY